VRPGRNKSALITDVATARLDQQPQGFALAGRLVGVLLPNVTPAAK
jgi:hypothetical protein